MLRFLPSLLLLCWALSGRAQSAQYQQLMARGKAEFKKEFALQNYAAAVKTLEAAVRLQPANPEAHYFLGYAYSRLNCKDGEALPRARLPLTLKASQEFETVNRLTPHYRGEELALDPYAKIASEWSSLAVHYTAIQKPDSARWAYAQGRKRGGFSDFVLANATALLQQCRPNGLLVSAGDAFTFPLWYLQTMNGLRPDVTVVDVGLLGSRWFPALLENAASVAFKLPGTLRDSIDYLPWKTTVITIPDARTQLPFSWKVAPTVDSQYLYRTDVLLLALLQGNGFKRDVYFTPAFPPEQQLGLRPNTELKQQLVVHRVNAGNEPEPSLTEYLAGMKQVLPLVATANMNSGSEVMMVRTLRYGILDRLNRKLNENERPEIGPLVALVEQYFPTNKYPFESPDLQALYEYARAHQ
ncbi:tetratricopeptide repeat protein [Hymenobacter armeniacus]|uniref:Tetratricopeptide repeat protein n=1 Tax=Hymenobacter armeniacus TaxID=2771358 RepID=A0ABR8JRR9_9BACT|nr:tetratricopeptide repeat protein [Hymenobacter armeniacus]MBD2722661.1 tetratricopeptide repeat protein [Hymenobacter armeniacus]